MNQKILDNSKDREVVQFLVSELPKCVEAKFAIGYFYITGFRLVEDQFPVGNTEKPILKIVMGNETDIHTGTEIITGYERREKLKQEILEELQNKELSEEEINNVRSLANLIENGSIEIRLYDAARLHAKLYLFIRDKSEKFASKGIALLGSSNFTQDGLTRNKELNTIITDKTDLDYLDEWYDSLWSESIHFQKDLLKIMDISGVHKNKTEKDSYPKMGKMVSSEELFMYLVYRWFDGKVMNMLKKDTLAEFQMVGVLNTIHILDYYNGAIVADSVGLGKSFIAMAIIEEFINKKHLSWIQKEEGVPCVLLIVPPSVLNQWEELIIGSMDSVSDYEYLKAGKLIQIKNSEFFKNKQVIATGNFKENDKTFEIYTDDGLELLGRVRLYSVGLFQSNANKSTDLESFRQDYDLIVVDEAHKFKNKNSNRWKALKQLHKKKSLKLNKMLLLTATPMSNSIYELYNLIRLFNDDTFQPFTLKGIMVTKLFEDYSKAFQEHKKEDNDITKKELMDRASELKNKVIDEIVLLRTRNYIKNNFSNVTINDRPLVFKDPVVYSLDYSIYSEGKFSNLVNLLTNVLPVLEFEHTKLYGAITVSFGNSSSIQESSKTGSIIKIADIFRLLLGKRLESSVYALETTIRKILSKEKIALSFFIHGIDKVKTKKELQNFLKDLVDKTYIRSNFEFSEEEDFLSDDAKWFDSVWNLWSYYSSEEIEKNPTTDPIEDALILKLGSDRVILNLENDVSLLNSVLDVLDELKAKDKKGDFIVLGELPKDNKNPILGNFPIWLYQYDPKIISLKQILGSPSEQSKKLNVPNLSDKQTLLFSQYKDTAYYVFKVLEHWTSIDPYSKEVYTDVKHNNRSKIGLVTGDTDASTRINTKKRFAPKANNGEEEVKRSGKLKVLVATDAFSEGVNLQDGNAVVNFDLPWNPMLIVQRVGRINRIGSENDVDVINFRPTDELQLIVSVLSKLKEKIHDITNVLGKESKILDPDEEISIETFGQKIKKLSEVSMEDLENMGVSDELKSGFSIKEKLMVDEFSLLNEIQFGLRYSPKEFEKFGGDEYKDKVLYSFITGSDRLFSFYEFKRGKEGERKTLEKKILSAHPNKPEELSEESPLSLLHLVKGSYKSKPTKVLEIAEALKVFRNKVEERKQEIEDSTVIQQRGFFNKLIDFLGRHANFKVNDSNWSLKFPIVFNKLSLLKPTEHVPKIRSLLEESKLLLEKSGKVGLKDPDAALDVLYEYLKDKTDIDFEQEVTHYGWFYER